MIFVFYILAALLVWFSYKSLRSGIAYLKYFKQGLAKPASEYAPFVSVIAPCRGVDHGLEENLMALLEQDYPAFEVIFVVDDESDQAISVIKRLSRKDAKYAKNSRLIIAPKAVDSSQKVENLREAVLYATDESDVFAFVDSDTRPAK